MSGLRLIGVANTACDVAGLVALACGDRFAIAEACDGASNIDAVKRHHRLVLALLRQGPALPAPFGPVFDAEAALLAAVAQRARSDLDRYAVGFEEWSFRCRRAAEDQTVDPASGRAYLRAQGQRRRDEAARQSEIADLGAGWRDRGLVEDVKTHLDGPNAVRFSLLVARARRDAAVAIIGACLDQRLSGWTIKAFGPWPIYSFTGLDALAKSRTAAQPSLGILEVAPS